MGRPPKTPSDAVGGWGPPLRSNEHLQPESAQRGCALSTNEPGPHEHLVPHRAAFCRPLTIQGAPHTSIYICTVLATWSPDPAHEMPASRCTSRYSHSPRHPRIMKARSFHLSHLSNAPPSQVLHGHRRTPMGAPNRPALAKSRDRGCTQ